MCDIKIANLPTKQVCSVNLTILISHLLFHKKNPLFLWLERSNLKASFILSNRGAYVKYMGIVKNMNQEPRNEPVVDPLVEFDHCPPESADGIRLIREVEEFLKAEAVPPEATWKKIGVTVLAKLSMTTGLYRPYPRQN